jgi:CHAT domain-containing protein/uncharacterized protein HemY
VAIIGDHDEAVKQYRSGLQIAEASGDVKLQADLLNGLVEIQIEQRSPEMEEQAPRARELAERASDKPAIARALKNLGVLAHIKNDFAKATEYFNQSLDQWGGEGAGRADALTNLGYTLMDTGSLPEASRRFDEARTLARAAGDRQKEARAALAVALVHTARGEWQPALDLYHATIRDLKEIGDKQNLTVGYNGLGFLYSEVGESEQALNTFNDALRLARRMKHRGREAVTLGHIGDIHAALGRNQKALGAYARQNNLAQSLKEDKIRAYALSQSGRVHESAGNLTKALNCYEQAVSIGRRVSHPRVLAYALDHLGNLLRRQRKYRAASECQNEARSLMEAAGDSAGELLVRYNIAKLEQEQGRIDDALRDIQNVIESAESRRATMISSDLRTSYSASTYRNYELLIDLLMQKHKQTAQSAGDAAAFEISELGKARGLSEMLAEARADVREGVSADLINKEDSVLAALRRKAADEIKLRENKFKLENSKLKRGENRDQHFADNRRDLESVAREIGDLQAQLEQVTTEIKLKSTQKSLALSQPRRIGLEQLQEKLLDDETLVLEYSLGEDRSYLWVVGRSSLNSYELPGRAKIEEKAIEFYKALISSPGRSAVKARQLKAARDWLTGTLVAPVSSLIGSKRLVIVPDGALHYIPFAALKSPGDDRFLVENHELATLPSLSVLMELKEEAASRTAPTKTLAVIADPVLETGDPRVAAKIASSSGQASSRARANRQAPRSPAGRRGSAVETAPSRASDLFGAAGSTNIVRLSFTAIEAKALAQLLPESERRVWDGFAANRTTAIGGELEQYRIIHFATHGFVDFSRPKLSCLVLSRFDEKGEPRDGYLRLHDVYNMKLSADLVVLSACQTALGKEIRGEGLVGLTRGFMYAGAPRVVASLWDVVDDASAEFMGLFYKKLLSPERPSVAAALRQAQIEMMRDERRQDPFYWAAFVLQGEWK